jgi:PAS domain S-box-containing protein
VPETRIMVVEDESITAMGLEKRLTKQGYNVVAVVASGEEAVRRAEETSPDLVLMDIMLEGEMDGVEAAGRIASRLDIPIIYLTAYADENTLLRAKITEPFAYLLKPFQERELLITIEMALYKHAMEKKLKRSEQWLAATLKCIGDALIATDASGSVAFMNPVAEELTGWKREDAMNRHVAEVCNIVDEKTRAAAMGGVMETIGGDGSAGIRNNAILIDKNGREMFIDETVSPIRNDDGVLTGVVLVFRDITERKRMEAVLLESEKKLRDQSEELMESNTALKVLLKQIENEKRIMEEKILSNVNKLILPYIERLKRNRSMSDELDYLNILEANVKEIVSPFSVRMSSALICLTPKELQVANLIKEGRENKEVAELLNMSLETVKTHRQNIRKKLNIYAKRIHLRTYLLSFKE